VNAGIIGAAKIQTNSSGIALAGVDGYVAD